MKSMLSFLNGPPANEMVSALMAGVELRAQDGSSLEKHAIATRGPGPAKSVAAAAGPEGITLTSSTQTGWDVCRETEQCRFRLAWRM